MKNKNMNPLRGSTSLSSVYLKEDFLHYIWKFKLFNENDLILVDGERLQIVDSGTHNFDSGPDFTNAKIKIDDQLWAGNVEIHIKSSDWYVHHHEKDENYDAVILHVVWENDIPVLDKNGIEFPTLILKDIISKVAVLNYQTLMSKTKNWILCEGSLAAVDEFTKTSWLSRLYFERLEKKSVVINNLLTSFSNDWEQVLFVMLFKNFGLKLNGDAFYNLATSFDFPVVRKLQNIPNGLETLFFGQAGFLEEDIDDLYFTDIKKEYLFIKRKFNLKPLFKGQIQFFRLRPSNFPTIRISQMAQVFSKHKNIFSQIQKMNSLEEFYELFAVSSSDYWNTHFTFGKVSKKNKKRITKSFVDLLLINTIIPVKYAYLRYLGKYEFDDLETLLRSIKRESNSIISNFSKLELQCNSAFESQALIELKTNYCDKQNCLKCAIGLRILKKES